MDAKEIKNQNIRKKNSLKSIGNPLNAGSSAAKSTTHGRLPTRTAD